MLRPYFLAGRALQELMPRSPFPQLYITESSSFPAAHLAMCGPRRIGRLATRETFRVVPCRSESFRVVVMSSLVL
jgi:hypothetical protein